MQCAFPGGGHLTLASSLAGGGINPHPEVGGLQSGD